MQHRKEAVQPLHRDESLTALIGDLANQSAGLVRDEMALAKQEISEKLLAFRASLMVIAIGAVVGLIAALALSAAVIAALATVMPVWQAALIVGAVCALSAAIVLAYGIGHWQQASLKPQQTIKTLEENRKWLKEIT
ncbi:MAG: phage holin family protein [Acidobacteria bacterium]|nr:phage holin family protein [Acidobacteriota bacterium]